MKEKSSAPYQVLNWFKTTAEEQQHVTCDVICVTKTAKIQKQCEKSQVHHMIQ